MSQLRVRFAPSPTGYLHIGGARTALFNYLLARRQQGCFVLRIEDTDVARSTEESVDAILQAMSWLGLSCDEGPYYQSQRFDLYRSKVEEMLANGQAYRCYCTAEELDAKRTLAEQEKRKPKYDGTCRDRQDVPADQPFVVRFRAPEQGITSFEDRIKGTISFQNEELDDLIVQRSDGTPTYNFVVVIDDAEMKINLVIRGDDHINNTPRQILLYQALGYAVPEFAHVPMILGSDHKRLSKRHGATSVMTYRELGYLPEAMVNYLVRLGWSHGDQEIFSMEELIEKFSLDHVGRSAGVFNPEKLLWLNAHYIKTGDPQRLGELLAEYLVTQGINCEAGPLPATIVPTLQDRCKTMVEMAEQSAYYYCSEVTFDPQAAAKFLTADQQPVFDATLKQLGALGDWQAGPIEEALGRVIEETGLKFGKIAQPLRVALTGNTVSPSICQVMAVMGKDMTLSRIQCAAARLA